MSEGDNSDKRPKGLFPHIRRFDPHLPEVSKGVRDAAQRLLREERKRRTDTNLEPDTEKEATYMHELVEKPTRKRRSGAARRKKK